MDAIVITAVQEDGHLTGLSILSGGLTADAPLVMQASTREGHDGVPAGTPFEGSVKLLAVRPRNALR